VTVVFGGDDGQWSAVTGPGEYADAGRVEALAESLREDPQPVDLALGVAPQGWSLVAYKEDRILTLAPSGETGGDHLSVALVERRSRDLASYGAWDVETVTVNALPAQLGRQASETGDPSWILVAQTASGQAFSLQAPAIFTREQVVRTAAGVTYRP
jgi:hypothetical protein